MRFQVAAEREHAELDLVEKTTWMRTGAWVGQPPWWGLLFGPGRSEFGVERSGRTGNVLWRGRVAVLGGANPGEFVVVLFCFVVLLLLFVRRGVGRWVGLGWVARGRVWPQFCVELGGE